MQTAEDRLKLVDEDLAALFEELSLSFFVDFTEEDYLAATTVGGLFDCVLRKMAGFEASRCLSVVAFNRVRAVIAEIAGVERRSIRPASSLREVLPARLHQEFYEALANGPRLRGPRITLGLLGCWLVAGVVVAGCAGVYGGLRPDGFDVALGCAVLVGVLCVIFARRLKVCTCETVGDRVREIVLRNQAKLARDAGGSTVSQAWWAFRTLVAQACGKRIEAIDREMRFPADLGIY